jgi:hypothetical protein
MRQLRVSLSAAVLLLIFLTQITGCAVTAAYNDFTRESRLSYYNAQSCFSDVKYANAEEAWRTTRFKELRDQACLWLTAGFTEPEEASVWQQAGFGPIDAKNLKSVGADPTAALLWKKSGFTVNECISWFTAKTTISDALGWKSHDISAATVGWYPALYSADQIVASETTSSAFRAYREAGLPFDFVSGWTKVGLKPEDVQIYGPVAAKDALVQKRGNKYMEGMCPTQDRLKAEDLVGTNPYAVKGKCYDMGAVFCYQLLSRRSGLYNLSGDDSNPYIVKLNFPATIDAPVKGVMFEALIKGVGAEQYTSSAGVLQTVPVFKVVGVGGLDKNSGSDQN